MMRRELVKRKARSLFVQDHIVPDKAENPRTRWRLLDRLCNRRTRFWPTRLHGLELQGEALRVRPKMKVCVIETGDDHVPLDINPPRVCSGERCNFRRCSDGNDVLAMHGNSFGRRVRRISREPFAVEHNHIGWSWLAIRSQGEQDAQHDTPHHVLHVSPLSQRPDDR
jgi:hypothetical protein